MLSSHTIELSWPNSGIAVVKFGDLARSNQLCWAAVDELAVRLRHARESGARVIVLASSVPGHWLEHAWLQDLSSGLDGEEQTGTGEGWFRSQQELGHEDIVSIAAVSGNASGGGAELGWACDLRVAEEQVEFSQPEVDLGLTTGIGGTSRLARLVGRSMATQMVLTGSPQSARKLHQLGGINFLTQRDDSMVVALELAEEFLQRSPLAVSGLKRILRGSDEHFLAAALELEQKEFQSVVTSAYARERMRQVQRDYDQQAGLGDQS